MRKGNLKNIIRQHIEKPSLSAKQLESLMLLQKGKTKNKTPFFNIEYRRVAITAVLFLALGNLFYFVMSPDLTLNQRIGSEVAKNHLNLRPLEIKTSNIEEIRGFLSNLGFSPVESVLLKGRSKTLLGGRYCSIQGVRAAQLRLQDSETGEIQSLYQTVYDKNVFYDLPELKENQKPVTVYSKGLAVDIWVEKGLLFALTREANK